MRITKLGHASLVFETPTTCLFMDPVFSDPFHDGIAVSCPTRVVHIEALPTPDAIFISHSHTDHIDLDALSRFPDVPIYAPNDPEIRSLLRPLRRPTNPVKANVPFTLGDMTLTPTGSMVGPRELGLAVAADGITAWNMVDTTVDQRLLIETLRLLGGPPALAIVGYQPLLEFASLWATEVTFPHARYHRMLEMAIATRANVIVPGSAGLACPPEDYAYINHRLFPVDRYRFAKDLNTLAPEVNVEQLLPGKAIVLDADGATLEDSPYATCDDADESWRSYEPDAYPVPPYVEDNPRNVPTEDLVALSNKIFAVLPEYLDHASQWNRIGPTRHLRDRRARVTIRILLPDDQEHTRHISTWAPTVQLDHGPDPDADYTFTYRCSDIHHFETRGVVRDPFCEIKRRQQPAADGFRLDPLGPARINGLDPFYVVDQRWPWHILSVLQ